jgi:hypothetical protein
MSRSPTTIWRDDLDHQASATPSETVRFAAQAPEEEQRKEADEAAIQAEVSASTAVEFQAYHAELTDTRTELAHANTELRKLIRENATLLRELSAYRAQQGVARPYAGDHSPLVIDPSSRLRYLRATSQELREEAEFLIARARMLRGLRRRAGGGRLN